MKYNIIIIVFTCFICNSCNECDDTELAVETKVWLEYYQKNEYSFFKNNNITDTTFIFDNLEDLLVQVDNCSSKGECMCEIRSYSLVSENLKYSIYAYDNQIIRITIGNSINNSVLYYTKKRVFENFGNYNGILVNFEYKNSLYEAIELQCTDCNQIVIQRIVISKELGVLEYEDSDNNVWVKQ